MAYPKWFKEKLAHAAKAAKSEPETEAPLEAPEPEAAAESEPETPAEG